MPFKDKPENMQKVLDAISEGLFFNNISSSLKKKCCVYCGEVAEVFRDKVSEAEYKISALCQTCQDKFFGLED